MMHRFLASVFFLAFVPALTATEKPAAFAPEATPPFMQAPQAPRAWLGLELCKPDEGITAHVPGLPPGLGFVVRSVAKGGPAEAAGLREFDLLWKLGDQMLVNEGQLAALLRLSQPGEVVELSGFRAGRELRVRLTLGETPGGQAVAGDLLDGAILPGEAPSPLRVVNISEKVASYSNEEGSLEVRLEGDGYKVRITAPDGQTIYEGGFAAAGEPQGVPAAWQRRVQALRRGLDYQLSVGMAPVRQPRPRVVPPPDPKP